MGSWRAWAQLVAGLAGYAVSIVLMIRSGLGLGPWDALHVGLARLTGASVGLASIAAGVAIVAGSWLIGIRPGPATLLNMVLIGALVDLLLPFLPPASGLAWGYAFHLAGIAVCGLSTGCYIAARLGQGPRDGLILGLSARTRFSVRAVRTAVELSALLLGWAMGAPVGVGTLLFAFGIGPAMQWGMRIFRVAGHERPASDEP
ncbi:MAG TPA: hypothetical protein VFR81_13120 [Longimicrobium sp.]|nr:hypothetical protein [Longimicrobium sp.]